ncbi:MAG: glutathione S-transferase family protein [Proteobacteria bacterium]|nr:glutathione S-transferase family protein [Pseudomonadota bacterium]
MITLYHSVASRSFVPLWLLEGLGIPFDVADTDIRHGRHKAPDYLKINPMGKVPALRDGDSIVTEVPAICLYLADRYGYGVLAPKIEDPRRGAYLRWTVFATAAFEPAAYLATRDAEQARHVGWGLQSTMLDTFEQALHPGPWLLGDMFSAADVVLGGVFAVAYFNKRIPSRATFDAYNARITERPAFKRASARTWPPELFGG